MFINLTNHPSYNWNKKQKLAADKYGQINDLPFPEVMPNLGHQEIQLIADKYAQKIYEMANNATVTVHVMGEMTFTYALVSRLKAEGITCVASTTERIVTEKDGVKTSEFRFVRFREY